MSTVECHFVVGHVMYCPFFSLRTTHLTKQLEMSIFDSSGPLILKISMFFFKCIFFTRAREGKWLMFYCQNKFTLVHK